MQPRIFFHRNRPILLAASALLLYAGFWSVRFALADFFFLQNTTAAIQRAVALDPVNAQYRAWLAEHLENESQDPIAALRSAVHLNPYDSRLWIRLGLNAEVAGKPAEAERLLLHAAAIDRLMEPRWTLMNFYFRSGNADQFWRWAKESFVMSYGDRTPLFDLCWQVQPDASVVASKALPPTYPVLIQFLRFLLARDQVEQAATLAEGIVQNSLAADKPAFDECLRRLVAKSEAASAVRLWNALCRRGVVPYQALDPGAGRSLTNGDFSEFPNSDVFNWHLTADPSVRAIRLSPAGLQLFLSSNQPDVIELLSQTLPLNPSQTYRLQFSYQTSGLPAPTGLHFNVSGQSFGDLNSDTWRTDTLTFHTGRSDSLAKLVLEYRRPVGSVRAEGDISLRDLSLSR